MRVVLNFVLRLPQIFREIAPPCPMDKLYLFPLLNIAAFRGFEPAPHIQERSPAFRANTLLAFGVFPTYLISKGFATIKAGKMITTGASHKKSFLTVNLILSLVGFSRRDYFSLSALASGVEKPCLFIFFIINSSRKQEHLAQNP
jgi:hypothetical protein